MIETERPKRVATNFLGRRLRTSLTYCMRAAASLRHLHGAAYGRIDHLTRRLLAFGLPRDANGLRFAPPEAARQYGRARGWCSRYLELL